MENNFSEELINEMSRNMCFYADSCTEKSCYKANCEKTWLSKRLLRQGWHKQIEAEWTGILPRDYAHAEGIPSYATPEQRAAYHDMFNHITHCSNCSAMFDNRDTRHWAYCPRCGAKMTIKGEK